jgi:hypothetical protein
VNIGAVGGMVAGDMVNTASRISLQPSRERSSSESTKRSADATIVFEPAGEHRS